MSHDLLTPEARRENASMLASILGVALPDAEAALEFDVRISIAEDDANAAAAADELAAVLGRTVRTVHVNGGSEAPAVEIVVGSAEHRTQADKLYLDIGTDQFTISDQPSTARCASVHGLLRVLIACYASAATMQRVFGDRLPFSVPLPLRVSFAELGVSSAELGAPIDLGHAYLAGAGAIGNGFLWAARFLDLKGRLEIADDDKVSSGNLNRQIWFTKDDLGKPKAIRLANQAQSWFSDLKLEPRCERLQDLAEKSAGPWLEKLLVAVDSRRARRKLQNEFPGEVFDASTTDVREVVVHHHKQVTAYACLSCIYESDAAEANREAHIAEQLNVSVDEVRRERLSDDAARKIVERYPQLQRAEIVGLAYDTLFKQLCGANELKTLEGRQVIAPFAFVSVLAGTLLAVEVVRHLGRQDGQIDDNYWRVSPWHPPLGRRRTCRPKQLECEFCGNGLLASVNSSLWGKE